ncbi:sulfotransferase [Serinicoccus chungangensis]|uniref:sulfotransferase n=1 Tax=Serinicoccus chungangensis TaxID=767452 RepID=UPI0009FA694D
MRGQRPASLRRRSGRTALLVTGMPRSGTTWLARLLAASPEAALTGREPMNPRGRQYGLAGTLSRWTRLEEPSLRQRVALRSSYAGLNLAVYSRYGRSQWLAPLPAFRVVVKDPFAMLSIPTIRRVTGAQAILVYRHPGAALASYRRMGWSPDLDELALALSSFAQGNRLSEALGPPPSNDDTVAAMAWFYNALYGVALADLRREPSTVVVSHEELAGAGMPGVRTLFDRVGLALGAGVEADLNAKGGASTAASSLHNFHRSPELVAREWHHKVTDSERRRIESLTGTTTAALEAARLPVG